MPKKKQTKTETAGGYDWAKIRTEYVTTRVTYRALAEKHGCSLSQLTKRAAREKWTEARQNHRKKRERKAEEKIADRTAEQTAKQIERLYAQAFRLLDKIERAIDELDRHVLIDTGRVEYKDTEGRAHTDQKQKLRTVRSIIKTDDMRRLGATLRDIKDVIAAGDGGADDEETGVLLLPAVQAVKSPPPPPAGGTPSVLGGGKAGERQNEE